MYKTIDLYIYKNKKNKKIKKETNVSKEQGGAREAKVVGENGLGGAFIPHHI